MKVDGYNWPPRIRTAFNLWEAVLDGTDGRESVFITNDGLVGKRPPQ
jgi:hypothetical protein